MRVVLTGLGMVAGTHVNAIIGTAGAVTLAGVMSRSTASAERFLDVHEPALGYRPAVYTSADAIAADPDVDAVLLCTPPDARQPIVAVLAAAGKPILMEKPVERTLAAARDIVELCEASGITLGIVFQHRLRQSAIALKRLFAAGTLGDLATVEIAVPWWRQQSYYDEPGRGSYARDGGGVLISQAIHTLDLLLDIVGPVCEVQAMAHTSTLHVMEAEDFVSAGLRFANGAVGSLLASTASFPGTAESITLHCKHGTARLTPGGLDLYWHDGRHESSGDLAGSGGGADPMAFTHEWHQRILEDFVAAVAAGRAPVASGRRALAVHALIDALIESSRQGGAIRIPTHSGSL